MSHESLQYEGRPRRFVADRMLQRLARWLRAAGEDVAGAPPAADAGAAGHRRALRALADAEGRIVLTRDRAFPGSPGMCWLAPAADFEEQLVAFYREFRGDPLAGALTRCTLCNGPLAAVERDEVRDRLPPAVRARGSAFRRCRRCGQLYWEGSHTRRMRAVLARVRARLAAPGDAGGAGATAGDAHATLHAADQRSLARFDPVLRELFARYGYSWRGYRKVRRRLRAPLAERAAALGLRDFHSYLARLAVDAGERRRLNALLSISISRFFRDREDWRELAHEALPRLVAAATREGRRSVRALVLGGASGEEPYTLRMVWDAWRRGTVDPDLGPMRRRMPGGAATAPAARGTVSLLVVAVELRADLVARAKRAVYPASSVHSVPLALLHRYFEAVPGGWRLSPAVVDSVRWLRLDFYAHEIPGPIDLVLCRNSAFTYLAPGPLARVTARIRDALPAGGYLMLGGGEGRSAPEGFERRGRCLFQRADEPGST